MKVRILVSIAGNAEPLHDLPSFSFAPGDVVDLSDKLAVAWIDAGHAEKFKKTASAPVQETSSASVQETSSASVQEGV